MTTAEAILGAARQAFDAHGLEGLSMRDIARQVGITPMAIYRHYENKQALIDALVLDGLGAWSDRVAKLPPGDPLASLTALWREHLEFALEEPRRYEAAFLLHSTRARRYPDDFVAGKSPVGRLQLGLIEHLMAEGVLRATSAIDFLIMASALGQGLVTLYRAGRIAGGEAAFRTLYLQGMQRWLQSFLKESAA